MFDARQLSTALIVGGGVASFLANRYWERREENRRANLDLVSRQINEFYGPLLFALSSSFAAWQACCRELEVALDGPDAIDALTEDEAALWRHWCTTVFVPLNAISEMAIRESASLMVEDEVSESILLFLDHVSEFRVLQVKWEEGNFDRLRPAAVFPPTLRKEVASTYAELKSIQNGLISAQRRGVRLFGAE